MDVGQPVLRADGQFLDHELEIVVARQRDDRAVRIGGAHAERCRQRPAQRSGLTAIDPVARLVDMQELRAGDLAEADRRDVAGVAAEGLVHLLIDALRLQRRLVEMRLALHRLLALAGIPPPSSTSRAACPQSSTRWQRRATSSAPRRHRRRRRDPARRRGRSASARCRYARTCGPLCRSSTEPVWRLAQRLPTPSTKSEASMVALP